MIFFSTRRVRNERNILYKTKRKKKKKKNKKFSILNLRYLYIMSLPSRKNNALTTTTTTTNRNETFEEIGQRIRGSRKSEPLEDVLLAHQCEMYEMHNQKKRKQKEKILSCPISIFVPNCTSTPSCVHRQREKNTDKY